MLSLKDGLDRCIVYDSLFCECSLALPKNGQPDLCKRGRVRSPQDDTESEQLSLLILTPLAWCGAHAKGVLGRGL